MKILKKICVYFLLKYCLFYLIVSIINQNFSIFRVDDLRSFENIFYYMWLILFFPIISIFLFSFPIHYSLKLNSFYKYLLNLIFIIIEFFIFIYFTSQKIEMKIDYIIFILLGIILFPMIFLNFKNKEVFLNK